MYTCLLSLSLLVCLSFTHADCSSLYPLIWLWGQTDKQTDQKQKNKTNFIGQLLSHCVTLFVCFSDCWYTVNVVYSPTRGNHLSLYLIKKMILVIFVVLHIISFLYLFFEN